MRSFGHLPISETRRIDREWEGRTRLVGAVLKVAAFQGVTACDPSGQLDQIAVVLCLVVISDAGLVKGRDVALALDTVGVVEPESVLHDRSADGRLVRRIVGEGAGPIDPVVDLERSLGRPIGLVEIASKAPREDVAATLGNGVDHATREPAVLGWESGGQDLHFLERVLDEEVIGVAEDVVVRVDTVDQEDVVIRERSVDRDLTTGRRIGREAWGQLGNPEEVPTGRQPVDVLGPEVVTRLG